VTAGRVVAIVVMLTAISFVTVVTAAVTAILIDRSRGVPAGGADSPGELLVDIKERLARLERALAVRRVADATGHGGAQAEPTHEHIIGGRHGNGHGIT
jgi:hypothetical protein